MTRVGLTGNYGMGKSLVLSMFRELGAFTISSDKVVAELLAEEAVLEKIMAVFGDAVFDSEGRLLKEEVAGIIFSDPGKKQALESILHPLVFERIEELIKGAGATGDGVVVIEVPLLFEGGYEGRFQKTITVYSDDTTAINRLEETGIKRKNAAVRIASQMPIEEKIRRSDFTIDNNGAPEETRKRVRQIYDILRENR